MPENYISGWQKLGSSHSRTVTQKTYAARSVRDHLMGLPVSTLPVFTNGSVLSNPGPCGSAAVVFVNGLTTVAPIQWFLFH